MLSQLHSEIDLLVLDKNEAKILKDFFIPDLSTKIKLFIFYGSSETGRTHLRNLIVKAYPESTFCVFSRGTIYLPQIKKLAKRSLCIVEDDPKKTPPLPEIKEIMSFNSCNVIYITSRLPNEKFIFSPKSSKDQALIDKSTIIHFTHTKETLLECEQKKLSTYLSLKLYPELANIVGDMHNIPYPLSPKVVFAHICMIDENLKSIQV
jgi:hypothetical protein